jgi:hypothetical protein
VDGAQIEHERRGGLPAALAALGAMLLPVLAISVPRMAVEGELDTARRTLLAMAEAPSVFLGAGILQAAGTALMAVVLLYLYRATRARRPETPSVVGVLAIVGPLLFAGVLLVSQVALVDAAERYARQGGDIQALLRGGAVGLVRSVGFAGAFAMGLAILLASLNAMRAGLLSRFLGALGIAIGVVSALPLFGGTLPLQSFWLGALALLFLDRWPGGRGPAWRSGRAERWPSPAEVRARRQAGGGAAEGAEPSREAAQPERARPSARKRKRRVR